MAKPKKPTAAELADATRRKGNRYYTGASDKAMESGSSRSNIGRESSNESSNILGGKAMYDRSDSVRKPKGTDPDRDNARKERIDALRAVGMTEDKKPGKKKK